MPRGVSMSRRRKAFQTRVAGIDRKEIYIFHGSVKKKNKFNLRYRVHDLRTDVLPPCDHKNIHGKRDNDRIARV